MPLKRRFYGDIFDSPLVWHLLLPTSAHLLYFKTLCPSSVQATVLPIQTRPGGMQSFAILAATVHHSAMRLLYVTPMLRKLGRTESTSLCGFMATCFRPSTKGQIPHVLISFSLLFFSMRFVDDVVQHDAIARSDPCYRRVVDHGERACLRPRKRSSSSGGSRRTFPCNPFLITSWFLSGPERSRSST